MEYAETPARPLGESENNGQSGIPEKSDEKRRGAENLEDRLSCRQAVERIITHKDRTYHHTRMRRPGRNVPRFPLEQGAIPDQPKIGMRRWRCKEIGRAHV